ncbi:MAG: hypothetical protein WD512_02400, partial [Candidatus Paceibacterota bacterium]
MSNINLSMQKFMSQPKFIDLGKQFLKDYEEETREQIENIKLKYPQPIDISSERILELISDYDELFEDDTSKEKIICVPLSNITFDIREPERFYKILKE